MEMDPDIYQQIVEHHNATRPVVPEATDGTDDSVDITRPEDVGQEETPYMEALNDDRGMGEGSVKETKKPEIS